MRKTLVTLALAATAVMSSHAQGWVIFANSVTTRVSTNAIAGGAATGMTSASAGSLYYYALFSSTATQNVGGATNAVVGAAGGTYAFNDGNWYFNNATGAGANYLGPDYGTNILTAGRFASTVGDTANNSGGTIVNSGASQSFVVIGWSANIGSTLAQLMTWYNTAGHLGIDGWVGESATSAFMTPGSGGLSTPPGIFGTGSGLIPGFTLGLVIAPEPSTIALAGLGGLSLLLFRRRK